MNRLSIEAESPPAAEEDVSTPRENDLLISRLVARIAELEERLYKKELEAPAIVQRSPAPAATPTASAPGTAAPAQQTPSQPRLKDSIFATLRDSWAKLEAHATGAAAAAAAAAAAGGSSSAAQTPAGGGSGGGAALGDDEGQPMLQGRSQSFKYLQPEALNVSTHLVVDYSKPNRSASESGEGLHRQPSTANDDPNDLDRPPRDDDDRDSLSSVDSTGLGYDAEADAEAARQRERKRERAAQQERVLSHGRAGPGSGGGATGGRGQAGSAGGDGTPGAVPSTPTGAAAAGRPPLPRGRRNGSDGGAGPGPGPASSAGPVAPAPTPSATPQPASTGRGGGWSGSVLSKLGLPWGRDKGADSDGGRMSRNASAQSLQQYGQGQGPHQYQYLNSRDTFQYLSTDAFSEKALEEQLTSGGGLGVLMGGGTSGAGGGGGHYYRYVFDPVDVQAEMEVTARVRRAAAEALMEANAKLAEAQAAAAALQLQVEQAKQLEKELESLRAERSSIEAAKASLEDDMAGVRVQLEGMKESEATLQAELESVRSQADIWRSSKDGESEKLKQENNLLRSQLTTRLSELQAVRTRLSEGEAERQRMAREAEDLLNKIQWLTKINLQLEASAGQLNDARKAAAEWQERFMRERNVRRRLHDQLQQLRGNIRVMCRVRPSQPGSRDVVTYPLEGLLAVTPPDRRYQEFEFDHVFPPNTDQASVFEEAVASLVRSCADGYNVCIFAYGQTGSGKTHTMQGPPEDPGIYVRALRELFRIASEEDGVAAAAAASAASSAPPSARASISGVPGEEGADAAAEALDAAASAAAATAAAAAARLGRYSFAVSMLEIYNEAVHDLLATGGDVTKALDVSGLGAGELPAGVDRVSGLTWRPVTSTEGVEALLKEGGRNRATASTSLNAHSSRSHALLSVRVTVTQPDGRRVTSMMHLVDLAGSERVDKSEVTGQQLKEAQSINRSLSALGDVISALQRRNAHIPFRNSKLTAVLQDSLCGSSKVLLCCNIAPESNSASESISSLNFASRAAQVELGAARRAAPLDRPSPSPSPYDRSPAPERADGSDAPSGTPTASGGGRGRAGPPSGPPLPIMNGTAAKVRAQAAAAASGRR
ncbi:hypothetical protein HYH03_015503 [Edaphochlamys debaryana]|uniref:Kinesin motor domain-containing protein n=1 Tax=Edaphochlamys debaryana TaxID=47281 RepID=A0A835XJB9_9CHLO|nr:hypothetical protein HYH03_015503 [Edaphochlamys debaryana]|eukprot:KAG2485792.1 hypothetical protein HYH03_015503 [Edaphochlamys debaryana]